MSPNSQPVLLFDGECGLCNAVVRFLLHRDRRGVLFFAPLQGEAGQAFLRARGMNTMDFDSIVFVEDMRRPEDTAFFLRTAGAWRALAELGGVWSRLARVLMTVPPSWGDVVYKGVARTRYRLFGEYRPRPLPNPAWERRFLP